MKIPIQFVILTIVLLVSLTPANAQPMTDPKLFGGGGNGLGGYVVGTVLGVIAFVMMRSAGDWLRWRTGKPALGRSLAVGGAILGLALFYLCAFKL